MKVTALVIVLCGFGAALEFTAQDEAEFMEWKVSE